mgnify:CR=1 FL=1
MKYSNKNIPQKYSDHENEIDLIALAKTLWGGRKEVVKVTLIFIGIGLLAALTTPAEYTSTVLVKPTLSDSKSKLGGSLGGLAAMAGINVGGGSSAAEIQPSLYPKIVESYSFQKELMESPIYVKELNSEVSFKQYYTELHTLSLLQILKKYTLELLIGFQVIAIVNFPKKQIANFMSECLVLGVVEDDSVVLLKPDSKTENGLRIA